MTTPELPRDAAHLRELPAVSVILTVVNESRHLAEAISSVLSSEYPGALEVIVAVGPSRDNTREIADRIATTDSRVRIIENSSGRTPDGLNAALRNARFDYVVRIDGHSQIDRLYIRRAIEILTSTDAVNVGGVMAAEGITTFERAVARAMRSPIGVGASRFHTGGTAGSVDTVYLGAFKKSALLAVGGYDTRFSRAQDWELNHRLRENGGTIWFDPELRVTYRPRNSIAKLARQYFEYGRWRRAVARQHKGTTNFRYLAPPLNLVLQSLSVLLGLILSPIFFIPTIGYLLAIFLASIALGKSVGERFTLPIVLIVMHFSWGFGFISSPRDLISK